MGVFIIRRVLYTIPILLGVAFIVFVLFNMVGGDPTLQMLGKHATVEQIQELRAELGFDKPQHLQFVDFLKQIVTFDYGRSYATKQKISEMILSGIPASLSITLPAFTIELILALSIALLVAFFRGTWLDKGIVVLCVTGMSISSLAFILFGQYVLAYKLELFPISGYDHDIFNRIQYVLLPVFIWVAVGMGISVRVYRTFILDEVYQDYVRTARAKGLKETVVMFKHVLKNAMIPVLTYTIIQIPFLIMGTFLLENFFGIPGIGSITVDAIHNSDFPVIKAMTTVGTMLFVAGTLVTDILYSWVDPRVRLR